MGNSSSSFDPEIYLETRQKAAESCRSLAYKVKHHERKKETKKITSGACSVAGGTSSVLGLIVTSPAVAVTLSIAAPVFLLFGAAVAIGGCIYLKSERGSIDDRIRELDTMLREVAAMDKAAKDYIINYQWRRPMGILDYIIWFLDGFLLDITDNMQEVQEGIYVAEQLINNIPVCQSIIDSTIADGVCIAEDIPLFSTLEIVDGTAQAFAFTATMGCWAAASGVWSIGEGAYNLVKNNTKKEQEDFRQSLLSLGEQLDEETKYAKDKLTKLKESTPSEGGEMSETNAE